MRTVLQGSVVDRAGFITISSGCFFSLLDGEAEAGVRFIYLVENHLCICLIHNSCLSILALRLLHEEFH